MKKWIQFNIDHPKIVLGILAVVTIFALTGFPNLYFDSSTEAMMPKHEIAYKMGERAKRIFGDSKTFILTAIEPAAGHELLSEETFNHLNTMVEEIEEFKEFDLSSEDKRLQALCIIGRVNIIASKTEKHNDVLHEKNDKTSGKNDLDTEIFGAEKKSDTGKDPEDELDKEIFEGKSPAAISRKKSSADILWDIDRPIIYDFYAQPLRLRNTYDYRNYIPVTLVSLNEKLDSGGRRQLETVLLLNGLQDLKQDDRLTRRQFTSILETWEDMYLYKSMEIIKTFINPISGQDIKGSKNELTPVDLVPENDRGVRELPATQEDFAVYRKKLENNPSFLDALYSVDEEGALKALAMNIVLKPLKDHKLVFDYLYQIIMKYNRGPVVLTPVGIPIFQKFIREYMQGDLKRFLPFVLMLVILTFYLNFRVFRGVVLPAVSVALGALWTMGTMGHLGIPITLVVNMLPPLLIAVGSSYSIHIFNQYLHDQKLLRTEGKKYGLVLSMNHISLTVILAALTTFISFMTLSVNQVQSLRHFGIFAALGTLFAMVISIMLIPSALMLMKLLPKKHGKDDIAGAHANQYVSKAIDFFSHISLRWKLPVVVISGILMVVFFYGLTTIRVETGPLFFFKPDSYLYQSDLRISRLFNGSVVLNVIFDTGKKGGAKDPEFLKAIEKMRRWIVRPEDREKYHQLHTISFGDIVKRMHKAMNGDNLEYYRIPDSRTTIDEYLEIYSGDDRDSDGRVDNIEQFIDYDYRLCNVMVRLGTVKEKPMSTVVNKKGQQRIKHYIESDPYLKNFRYAFTGEIVNFTVLSDLIVRGQIISILLTIAIVGMIIFILFKNWRAGLVSIIPISVSITVVYGLMGFFKIPLDTPKALLAAIAIGIGVDDTIHMLKTLRHNIKKGLSVDQALQATHREAGIAIVYTSIALVLGFSVLMLSGFSPVFYLGWLVSVTMISTTIAALVLLPAVIVLFKIPVDREMEGGVFKYIHLDKFFDANNNEHEEDVK